MHFHPASAAIGAILLGTSLGAQSITTITLQPDEASSKDVFVYEFGVGGVFGIPTPARATNLDTATLSQIPGAVPFGNFLGSANTAPLLGADGAMRPHDTRTLIQFDTSLLALAPAQVARATLNLYALPGLPPFTNPSAAQPLRTELRAITQPWSETGVTWDNQPLVSGLVSSAMQTGVDQWVSFDVTGLVQAWLTYPGVNAGVQLSQPDIVLGANGLAVASLYASSANADASLRPFLAISAVPEPTTYALFAMGLAGVALARRRQQRG